MKSLFPNFCSITCAANDISIASARLQCRGRIYICRRQVSDLPDEGREANTSADSLSAHENYPKLNSHQGHKEADWYSGGYSQQSFHSREGIRTIMSGASFVRSDENHKHDPSRVYKGDSSKSGVYPQQTIYPRGTTSRLPFSHESHFHPPQKPPDDYRRWKFAASQPPLHCEKIMILSYNILADYLVREHQHRLYCHIPNYILDWNWRKRRILIELGLWNADIMCFQEVDKFEELEEDLKLRGYNGVWKMRTGKPTDGCAIFWRASRFVLLQDESIEFASIGLRDNIAQLCVLELRRQTKVQDGSLVSLTSSSKKVVVCNTHVLYNPKRGDIKLGQVRVLLDRAHTISRMLGDAPVIICGDFNCTPKSPLYKFISEQRLSISGLAKNEVSGQASAYICKPSSDVPNPRVEPSSNNIAFSNAIGGKMDTISKNAYSVATDERKMDCKERTSHGSSYHLSCETSSNMVTGTSLLGVDKLLERNEIQNGSNSAEIKEHFSFMKLSEGAQDIEPLQLDAGHTISSCATINETMLKCSNLGVHSSAHHSERSKIYTTNHGTSCDSGNENRSIDSSVANHFLVVENSSSKISSPRMNQSTRVSNFPSDDVRSQYFFAEKLHEEIDMHKCSTDVVRDKKRFSHSMSSNRFSSDSSSELHSLDDEDDCLHPASQETAYVKHTVYDPYSWSPEETAAASGNTECCIVEHPLKLKSTYGEIEAYIGRNDSTGEPDITSYNRQFMGTVDYIWCSEGLQTVKVLDMIPKHVLLRTPGYPTRVHNHVAP